MNNPSAPAYFKELIAHLYNGGLRPTQVPGAVREMKVRKIHESEGGESSALGMNHAWFESGPD
jgi:hypothetical protein